jgi:hypothetical protein
VLIYTCISSHGFGHGSRTASVLAQLHRLRPHWRLVLSTALPESFLATAFGPVPVEQRRCQWDVGVLQADALGSDPAATLVALEQLEQHLPQQLVAEQAWLAQQQQPVLVLADVPPAAALLAERCGAPLVWLASFGWGLPPLGRALPGALPTRPAAAALPALPADGLGHPGAAAGPHRRRAPC